MRRLATWSVKGGAPKVLGFQRRRGRLLIKLWAELEDERWDSELRPRGRVWISECIGIATEELLRLTDGVAVVDAGFDVYQIRRG